MRTGSVIKRCGYAEAYKRESGRLDYQKVFMCLRVECSTILSQGEASVVIGPSEHVEHIHFTPIDAMALCRGHILDFLSIQELDFCRAGLKSREACRNAWCHTRKPFAPSHGPDWEVIVSVTTYFRRVYV